MLTVQVNQQLQVVESLNTRSPFPIAIEVRPKSQVESLVAELTPDTPWGNRKNAARQLGNLRDPEALPGLLDALVADPFWMVRCAIIQALEMIGDPGSIPTLQEITRKDSFQVVRSYALKAIERLSYRGQGSVKAR